MMTASAFLDIYGGRLVIVFTAIVSGAYYNSIEEENGNCKLEKSDKDESINNKKL